jgi:predicted RNA-binding protein associated with RNAse of E/G family
VPHIECGCCTTPRLERHGGVKEIRNVAFIATQVLAPQAQARLTWQDASAIAEAGGVEGLTIVEPGVEHCAREFRIVCPRPTVQVVRADFQPHIVDHTDLRVHVDGGSVDVLEVVERDAVPTGGAQLLDHSFAPDVLCLSREAAPFGVTRHHDDDVEVGLCAQCVGDPIGPTLRPEVLVLDVDELSSASERLAIRAAYGALAVSGEGIGRPLGGIRPQHLYGMRTPRARIGTDRRERMWMARLLRDYAKDHPKRVSMVKRRWIVPALAKSVRDVTDDGPLHLELEVVPGRSTAVFVVEVDDLRVATMKGIVVATMAEVHTTDERHVVIGALRTEYEDELLVVAAEPAHAFIEQDLGARGVHLADELRVLLLTEMSLARM